MNRSPESMVAMRGWLPCAETLDRARALLARRPSHLYGTARGFLLFHLARARRRISPLPGISLGENVRLQRNGSVMAEMPTARIEIGAHSIVYEDARLEAYGEGIITLGPSSVVGDARIVARHRVTIGARFLSSWNVFIQDYDPHPVDASERRRQVENLVAQFRPSFSPPPPAPPYRSPFAGSPIEIGDDVWVGANVTILKGVRLANGSIVATGSVVVAGDYPPGSVLAGNPARIVKTIF